MLLKRLGIPCLVFALIAMVVMIDSKAFAASADLTWNANGEPDLAGYKLYRGNQACEAQGPLAPLVINGTHVIVPPVSAPGFHDNTVPVFDGTLCYEVTAFDTANNESAVSNRASKVVNLIPPQAPTGMTIGTVAP